MTIYKIVTEVAAQRLNKNQYDESGESFNSIALSSFFIKKLAEELNATNGTKINTEDNYLDFQVVLFGKEFLITSKEYANCDSNCQEVEEIIYNIITKNPC